LRLRATVSVCQCVFSELQNNKDLPRNSEFSFSVT